MHAHIFTAGLLGLIRAICVHPGSTEQLKPFVGEPDFKVITYFMATTRMSFPFLACDVKCGAAAHQSAFQPNRMGHLPPTSNKKYCHPVDTARVQAATITSSS